MQGNARGTYESGGKVPEECREMQGNTGDYRGMPGERMGVGAKCQGNAGECRVMQAMSRESMGVGAKCQGNTGECQWNLWEWVQSPRGMLGNAGECQGNVWE